MRHWKVVLLTVLLTVIIPAAAFANPITDFKDGVDNLKQTIHDTKEDMNNFKTRAVNLLKELLFLVAQMMVVLILAYLLSFACQKDIGKLLLLDAIFVCIIYVARWIAAG